MSGGLKEYLASRYGEADAADAGKKKKKKKKKKQVAKKVASNFQILDDDATGWAPAGKSTKKKVYANETERLMDVYRDPLENRQDGDSDDGMIGAAVMEDVPKERGFVGKASFVQVGDAGRSRGASASPPPSRRERHDSSDDNGNGHSPPPRRRTRHDSPDGDDQSPPRRSPSPPRRERHDSPDGDDQSPPRRRTRHDSPDGDDQSPPRRRTRHDSPDGGDQSPPRRRRQRNDSPDDDDQSPPRQKLRVAGAGAGAASASADTFEGGLQSAAEVSAANRLKKAQIRKQFAQKAPGESGQFAETVHRDKDGKKLDTAVERIRLRREEAKKLEAAEKAAKWGKGIVQTQSKEQKMLDDLREQAKPMARDKNDVDMNDMLRAKIHSDDPMAQYMMKQREKALAASGVKLKPKYKGSYPPNRFNIPPGYKWDGRIRTNGFEEAHFKRMNVKKANKTAAYKWSSEAL